MYIGRVSIDIYKTQTLFDCHFWLIRTKLSNLIQFH